jgi:hypothetical protein
VKRSPIQRKAPMRRNTVEPGRVMSEAESDQYIARVRSAPRLVRGTYSGGTTAPAPKTEPYRDPVLLEMARGRPCLLNDPVICDHSRQPEDTVAAHSNLGIHGKAGARKADDCYSAWMCFCAHQWLDQGKASAAEKERRFMLAHANQVLAWRLVALDAREPERFRRAAARAVEHLNAAPALQLVRESAER